MQLLSLRNYAGFAAEWRADQAGTRRSIAENLLQRFDAAVRREYALSLVHTPFAEVSQNARVPVCSAAITTYLQGIKLVPP